MDKNNVAKLRKEHGYTQEHLAEICNINIRTIQRLEAGKETSLETLRLVSQALNVQVADLYESLDEVQGKDDILSIANKQTDQLRKRKTERRIIYNLPRFFFILIMLILGYFMSELANINTTLFVVACLTWIIAWPVVFSLFSYWRNFVLEPNWDKKYPLTIGIPKRTFFKWHSK